MANTVMIQINLWRPCAVAMAASLMVAASNAAHTAPANSVGVAETVLYNGIVYTVDETDSVREAIAVRRGRIAYVGTNAGAKEFIGKRTAVIDLHGKMVLPGLVDAHSHPTGGGLQLLGCDLKYASLTVSEFQRAVQGCLDATRVKEPDGHLMVIGWYRQAMLPSGTEVTRAHLDALRTSRPILVRSTDGHTTLANTRAIALAGISHDTTDPNAGRIGRDPSGQPTGIFEDSAQELVGAKAPAPTQQELLDAARAALDAFGRQGQTAFMAQNATRAEIEAWAALRRQGLLTARAYMAPSVETDESANPAVAVRRILDLKAAFDSGSISPRPNLWVRNSGEIFQDGVLQWPAQTASLLEPYLVNAGTQEAPRWVPGPSRGPDPYIPLNQLENLLTQLALVGIEPQVHAIGDRAVRHTLDAYAHVRSQLHGRDVRLEIAHAELVDPTDIARFKQLSVIPAMGFQWAKPGPDSIDAAREYLGPDRFARMEPEGYLDQIGVPIAQGSDWPVDPLDGWFDMEVLVTRAGNTGAYSGRLGNVPGVPIKRAIRAFTINGAYALHCEKDFGSLEKSKLADLIVIDQNLLKIAPERISETKTLLTMVGGQIVFRDPSL